MSLLIAMIFRARTLNVPGFVAAADNNRANNNASDWRVRA